MNQQNAPGAVPALVLGIIGIVACAFCAPFAIVQGRKGEAAADANPGMYGGRGMATAGKVLGYIGTVLLILAIVAVIALAATGNLTGNAEFQS